jgi:hypothetical protein
MELQNGQVIEMELTQEQIDRAFSVPWSVETCIVAQCFKEKFGGNAGCGFGSANVDGIDGAFFFNGELVKMQSAFDACHYADDAPKEKMDLIKPLKFKAIYQV